MDLNYLAWRHDLTATLLKGLHFPSSLSVSDHAHLDCLTHYEHYLSQHMSATSIINARTLDLSVSLVWSLDLCYQMASCLHHNLTPFAIIICRFTALHQNCCYWPYLPTNPNLSSFSVSACSNVTQSNRQIETCCVTPKHSSMYGKISTPDTSSHYPTQSSICTEIFTWQAFLPNV